MRKSLCYLTLAGLLATTSLSWAEPLQDRIQKGVEKLPEEWETAANKGRGQLGHQISNAIFDRIDDVGVYSTSFSGVSVRMRVGRRVYSNNDIEESFTVVDRMNIPFSLPAASIPIGTSMASFTVGLSGGLDFNNIRIVRPSDGLYTEKVVEELLGAKDLEARRQELESSSTWLELLHQENSETSSGDGETFYEGPTNSDRPLFLLDSLRSARYGRIWNLVSGPLRIPLKASWLSHLSEQEIVTYSGSGTIEAGPSMGMTYQFGSQVLNPLSLGASARAYLRGNFRISILKLGEKRSKVKVTRRLDRGFNGGVGSSSGLKIYDGFVVLGSTLGKIHESLVPFSFSADRSWGDAFEVGYEYDLNDERAINAYEQAVTGRLALSDKLASELESEGGSAPIQRSFTRDARESSQQKHVSIRMSLIEREGDGTYSVQDATVAFPDGRNRVYKARTDLNFSRKSGILIFEDKEGVDYSIQTDWVQNMADEDHAVFGWIAEGRIQDNNATGLELNRYSAMIQSLFGVENLFPTLPLYLPAEQPLSMDSDRMDIRPQEMTRYGQASYYFRIGLTQEQLKKLAQVPEEKMWKYLEQGFERPEGVWTRSTADRAMAAMGGWIVNSIGWGASASEVEQRFGAKFVHADLFRRNWKELSQLPTATPEDQKRFAKKVGEMFNDKTFGYELIKTTMIAIRDLGERDISYQVNAQSSAFPSLDIKSGTITEIERISQRYAKETNFEQPTIRQDLTLEVSNLKVEMIDLDHFRVNFSASKNPAMVVIKVDELSSYLKMQTTVRRLLIPNRGQFTAGDNTLLLTRGDAQDFRTSLANTLTPGKSYRITIALLDGQNAGPAQSREFFVNPKLGVTLSKEMDSLGATTPQ